MTTIQPEPGLGASSEAAATRPNTIVAPYRIMNDFLDGETVEALLRLALSREAEFKPTRVGDHERHEIRPSARVSRVLRSRETLKPIFAARLRELTPNWVADMALSSFEVFGVELELVAHGDGAFYKRHIDTHTGEMTTSRRVLSGVYYFNHQPKAFSGGALRLYAIGDFERFVDIEPTHNSLVVFPSWAPHEVMPVSCPSGAFVDSRFAVNCWIRQETATGGAVETSARPREG